jgi:hypothetical protein
LKINDKITLNDIDIWVINQSEAVCELKITLDNHCGLGNNEERNELYKSVQEKISRIVKDNHISEFVIDIS